MLMDEECVPAEKNSENYKKRQRYTPAYIILQSEHAEIRFYTRQSYKKLLIRQKFWIDPISGNFFF